MGAVNTEKRKNVIDLKASFEKLQEINTKMDKRGSLKEETELNVIDVSVMK